MTISQHLDLRQTQKLVMTPQLQQAIKLLQMSNQELNEFVATEIEQNPLLEQADDAASTAPAEHVPTGPENFTISKNKSEVAGSTSQSTHSSQETSRDDDDVWANDGYN